MSKGFKYFIIVAGILFLAFILWYFSAIITYILVAAVLSLIGRPLADLLNRIRIKKFQFPKAASALITLFVIWLLIFTFFRVFIPLIAKEAQTLSQIDVQSISKQLEQPLEKINGVLSDYNIGGILAGQSLEDFVAKKIESVLDFSNLTRLFSSVASFLGNIFIAFFSISFITFFFLKDDRLFVRGIMTFVPPSKEENMHHILSSIKYLLMRYFIGILIQITCIIGLNTLGHTFIAGVNFSHALLIGLFAGVFNVIPYIGPILGTALGLTIGLATHLHLEFYTGLLPLLAYMLGVFILVQLIDNVVFQPVIYSSSVKAHPLEIFLVILAAGYMGGIVGMILAIPSYTVLRVIAKEFFTRYKWVQKITERI